MFFYLKCILLTQIVPIIETPPILADTNESKLNKNKKSRFSTSRDFQKSIIKYHLKAFSFNPSPDNDNRGI